MVKYQFTSQDAETQLIQVTKFQQIIVQQADIINQLKMENDVLRLQLQKLSQQIDQTEEKQQSNSDLLGIKEENQNKVSSILSILQNDYDPFAQNSNNQYQNIFQNASNFQFPGRNIFSDLQYQSNQVEYEKPSQQNNNQTFLDAINQQIQKPSLFQNIFNNSGPSNINNLFSKEVSNEESQKQQINSQEDNEQESLLFGDPSNCYYNLQKSESKTSDKGQLINQEESINDQNIKQLENSKQNSSQNSSSFKASSNEKQEEFQIIERDEESNSI